MNAALWFLAGLNIGCYWEDIIVHQDFGKAAVVFVALTLGVFIK